MDAYTFLKFIHVFLAITAVGGNITYGDAVLRPPELDDAVDSDVTCRLSPRARCRISSRH